MKFSRTSLLTVLHLCASSSLVGADRALRSSVRTSSSASGEERNENREGNSDAEGKRIQQRRLLDFMEEAQEATEKDQLETLEENGDPDQVEIVDSVGDEEKEDSEMEEEGAAEVESEVAELEPEAEAGPEAEPEEPKIANRRKFVRYEPSDWESEWIDQIDDIIEAKSLCRSLLGSDEQKKKIHMYLDAICGNRSSEPGKLHWCHYEDATHYVWYNSDNLDEFEIYVNEMPEELTVLPDYDFPDLTPEKANAILSKLIFYDEFTQGEYTEYIEPLVSHLRFPLAACMPSVPLLAELSIGVMSPGYLERTNFRKILYDYGSSDWGRLTYIIKVWGLYHSEFSEVISYSTFTAGQEWNDPFPKTVPDSESGRVVREYMELTDAPTDDPSKVFIPDKITEQVVVNDYILLKLDTGNAGFKEKLVQYIIDHAEDLPIHELIWEQNNPDNYALETYMGSHASFEDMSSTTLGDTYRALQALRMKGIRAHAWI